MKSNPYMAKSKLWHLSSVLFGAVFLSLVGCSAEPIVVHKSVPKTRIMEKSATQVTGEPKYRMITAIIDRDSGIWFFKIGDTIEAIDQVSANWDAFLKSVKFDENDKPSWQLPEGWSKGPDRAMRFATLIAPAGDSQIDVSISSLPPPQDLLSNVNRWRGQLGLGRLGPVQLDENLSELKTDHLQFKIFDASGPTYSAGMGAPFAGGHGGPPMSKPAGTAGKSSEPNRLVLPFKFEKPEGWSDGNTNTVTVEQWVKDVDGKKAEISVLNMNPSDESWKMNVAAWSSQIKLDEKPDIEKQTQQIEIAGQSAKRIRLDAAKADADQPAQSVIAVMFAVEKSGWVIKFAGDKSLVDESMDQFEAFLKSISIH